MNSASASLLWITAAHRKVQWREYSCQHTALTWVCNYECTLSRNVERFDFVVWLLLSVWERTHLYMFHRAILFISYGYDLAYVGVQLHSPLLLCVPHAACDVFVQSRKKASARLNLVKTLVVLWRLTLTLSEKSENQQKRNQRRQIFLIGWLAFCWRQFWPKPRIPWHLCTYGRKFEIIVVETVKLLMSCR